MTGTGQQWQDFCVLIERFDWLEDETLVRAVVREGRRNEIAAYINDWTSQRSTDEVVEMASLLRIPVAPVGTGQSIPDVDHFVDRQMLVTARDGSFVQPSRPYRFGAHEPAPPATAPALGADSGRWETALPISVKDQPARLADGLLPFADLRIAELAGFWAGPSAAHLFAVLGAEVIKIESPVRPDGMRTVSTRGLDEPDWWEHAPLYHAVNTGKLSLGLRLDRARGRSVLERLLSRCDVLIENFSPRVLEAWGLGWEAIHAINPRLILVRMPAFGLAGPWRDRTGFAQTMEQASGMAWVTGFPEGAPVVPSGVCDPVAGAHAAFALQVALAERDRTGLGTLVEVPMVQSALNIAAEQVVEFSAYGRLVSRRGNRGTTACPQNLYRTLGSDGSGLYVALAVETDDQWRFLVKAIGNPNWAVNPEFADASGRRAAEEYIDEKLSEWIGAQRVEEVIDHLWGVGIPVARVTMPHAPAREQLDARSFFETVHQPVAGPVEIAGLPIRFGETVGRVHRSHAPLLGEHNHDVLARVLGLDADEIAELLADGTVGAGLGVER
jgi:crotonobetainyl-CoA:carnitine CoA-transferase CaiB-like acyl-CoA transferase